FGLSLLFVFSKTPVIIFETLLAVLLTPPFMAAFAAGTVSDAVTPFLATRPLTNAALIAAKLKVTIWSTVVAWLLVLAAIPAALRLSGASAVVMEWGRQLVDALGRERAAAIVLL